MAQQLPSNTGLTWWQTTLAIFGMPMPWKAEPKLRYNDPQVYPFNKTAAQYYKSDAVLTKDGKKLKLLKVQAAEYLKDEPNCTWQRRSIDEVSTVTMKISRFPLLGKARIEQMFKDEEWVYYVSWSWYTILWIFGLVAILLWFVCRLIQHLFRMVFRKQLLAPLVTYSPFHYEVNKYPRIASNPTDNRKALQRTRYDQQIEGDRFGSYGLIRPRMLLQTNGNLAPRPVSDIKANARYVFVAFSFNHFPFDDFARLNEVIRVGNKVAQQLRYEYFWISASCMGISDPKSALSGEERRVIQERDIYGISDIIRGASQVAIVLPDSPGSACPKLKDLFVDDSATDLETDTNNVHWYELEKHQFPGYVWKDRESSMQMVRHYRNVALTRLEFVKIAMGCLLHRQQQGIQWHYPGDLSYVLMGFLRIRPPINKYDSSFQAFARLSLPADNDRLMERFVCLQPPSRTSEWASMIDEFRADLWSIQPYIQVSGVGENDTIIIEKAWGARIEGAKFTDMSAINIGYWRRFEGVTAGLTIVPQLAASLARDFRRAKYRRVYPRLYSFEGFMGIPEIEERLFGSYIGSLKWSTNASTLSKHVPGNPVNEPKNDVSGDSGKRFAGLHPTQDVGGNQIEPKPEGDIEAQNTRDSIEVGNCIKTFPIIGQQPWTTCVCTSTGNNECSCPKMTDRKLRKMGQSRMGEDKIFTLIDTATMTVTLLKTAWPPQALIACGTEGGMERVLVCSYDWTTGVLYRESVIRLPGKVLESMHRLPGIRLGLKRTLKSADIASHPHQNPVVAPVPASQPAGGPPPPSGITAPINHSIGEPTPITETSKEPTSTTQPVLTPPAVA